MADRQQSGIADDAGDYEDFPEGDGASPSRTEKGISEDASLYEDLIDAPRDETLDLDSMWVFKLGHEVFGPITSKALVEKLYSGEINEDTPIAPEDGEFMALRRYGAFRSHLPKLEEHRKVAAEVKKKETAAKRARLRRKFFFVALLSLFVLAGFGSMWWYVQSQRAKEIAQEEEQRLRQEMEDLMASVTIEPPLIDLVLPDPAQPTKGRGRRGGGRRKIRPGANLPPGAELTREEIMGGVASLMGDIKRCIVDQMKQDRDSVPSRIVLSFVIGNEGKVRDVSIDDRFLRKSPMRSCLAQKLQRVQYRAFKGEVRNVEYPISIGPPK